MTELRERLLLALIHCTPAEWLPPPNALVDMLDALIAAGVTMPAPTCGATTVIDGCEYVCDQPPHRDTQWTHQCTDSVGVTCWWDGPTGPVVVPPVPQWRKPCDGWPISDVDHPCTLPAGHPGECF